MMLGYWGSESCGQKDEQWLPHQGRIIPRSILYNVWAHNSKDGQIKTDRSESFREIFSSETFQTSKTLIHLNLKMSISRDKLILSLDICIVLRFVYFISS